MRFDRRYRNPNFLQKIVEHFKIEEYGTKFPADVFDPNALHAEDYYDALGALRALSHLVQALQPRKSPVTSAPASFVVYLGYGAGSWAVFLLLPPEALRARNKHLAEPMRRSSVGGTRESASNESLQTKLRSYGSLQLADMRFCRCAASAQRKATDQRDAKRTAVEFTSAGAQPATVAAAAVASAGLVRTPPPLQPSGY